MPKLIIKKRANYNVVVVHLLLLIIIMGPYLCDVERNESFYLRSGIYCRAR